MSTEKAKPLHFPETQRLQQDLTSDNCIEKEDACQDDSYGISRGNQVLKLEQNSGWGYPLPLSTVQEAKKAEFPLKEMPPIFSEAIKEVIDYIKAPISIAAASSLSAASLAVQGHVDIERDISLKGPVGIYSLTVSDSGERKTTCDKYFTSAIREFQQEQLLSEQLAFSDYESKIDIWKTERNAILSKIQKNLHQNDDKKNSLKEQLINLDKAKPTKGRTPHLLLGDETPENLTWSLYAIWPSSAIISSEGGTVLGSCSMNKDTIIRTVGIMNSIWDDAPVSFGRRTTTSFVLHRARLTLGLQIQESVFNYFMSSTNKLARGSGFLSRFLISKPISTQGYRLYSAPPASWPALTAFNKRIKELLNIPLNLENGILQPKTIILSNSAKRIWIDYYNYIEKELKINGLYVNIRDIASKSSENAARLAAIFHVMDQGLENIVNTTYMENAVKISEWYLNEALDFMCYSEQGGRLTALEEFENWLLNFLKQRKSDEIEKTKIMQLAPNRLRTKNIINQILEQLETVNRVALVKKEKTLYVKVNPYLL